jgi:hypothetical protein
MSSNDRDQPDSPSRRARSPSVLQTIRLAVTAQVGVDREGKGWKLVLRGKRPAQPIAQQAGPQAPEAAPQSMREELGQLLDDAVGSRRALRQLCAIEHALAHKDEKGLFLFDTPLQHLAPALRQLDALSTPPLTPHIARLRALIVESIARQQAQQRLVERNAPLSSFMDGEKLEVSDARLSDFDRAFGAAPPNPAPETPAEPDTPVKG